MYQQVKLKKLVFCELIFHWYIKDKTATEIAKMKLQFIILIKSIKSVNMI